MVAAQDLGASGSKAVEWGTVPGSPEIRHVPYHPSSHRAVLPPFPSSSKGLQRYSQPGNAGNSGHPRTSALQVSAEAAPFAGAAAAAAAAEEDELELVQTYRRLRELAGEARVAPQSRIEVRLPH